MTAYNIVRMKVKAGKEQAYEDLHKAMDANFKGFVEGALVKVGDRSYCFVGKWKDFDSIVAARPEMGGVLGQMRDLLEDLGGGLGVTDPVSGSVIHELKPKR